MIYSIELNNIFFPTCVLSVVNYCSYYYFLNLWM